MPDNFLHRFRTNTWTMFFIRDFLMSCLLVFGGGHRGDVIRNMTLEEWGDRRKETSGPQKNEVCPVFQSWTSPHPTPGGGSTERKNLKFSNLDYLLEIVLCLK
jgi:hypothetical protein